MDHALQIQQIVHKNGIRELLHFTRIENLQSIISRGLLNRNIINHRRTTEIFNDELRLDGTGAVCVSIGFPNYKMLYRLRTSNPDAQWVIISIHPSALWQLRCAFCATNAASNFVTSEPLINRMTTAAFESMYSDFGIVKRLDLQIPDAWPTNPQAEVLFLDGIPRDYFMGVYTENTITRDRLNSMNLGIEFRVNAPVFSPRQDYKHWKSR